MLRTGSAHRPTPIACQGFSLIEVLVATTVLAAGVSTAVGLALASQRAQRVAQQHTMAVLLARAKIEQIRSLTWTRDAALVEVIDRSTNLAAPPAEPGGSGLTASPPGVLAEDVPGYVDYLDRYGAGTRASSHGPGAAVWVRRWSIATVPDATADVLRIEVQVDPVEYVLRQSRSGSRQTPGARLVAFRARRAR
ncbi:MAG: prepilin-type N-terminal cleavage/methylation domain-containing protein [Vicinamibacterales bacterium]